jgi:FkbM family methyltransferase
MTTARAGRAPGFGALRASWYWAHRLVQTPSTFANWPQVLRDMALGRSGRGPDELMFRTRSGVVITTPNRPGARVPVYEIFAEDCYRLQWLLGDLAQRPIQVIDIGGHVGTFAVRLTQLHPQATLRCFEPSATTAEFLRRNAERNGVADRVTVVEQALASTSGVALYDDNGAGSGLNGLVALGHTSGIATTVGTTTFDDVIAASTAPVDLVKIDCEGGEFDLVLSSTPSSWDSVSRVVIESHPVPGHSWPELRDWFARAGLAVQDEVSWGGYACAWLSREPLPAFRH